MGATPRGTGAWPGSSVGAPPASPLQRGPEGSALHWEPARGAAQKWPPPGPPPTLHGGPSPSWGQAHRASTPKHPFSLAPRPPPRTKLQLPLPRHFCTRHGTLTRTTCGLAHAPSPLLFMRQAEAGGDPETGGRGGGGEAGVGANVCFQYAANRGLFPLFRIILYWVDVFRA